MTFDVLTDAYLVLERAGAFFVYAEEAKLDTGYR